ncbi:MAG: protein-glutamate O-methyltransferase CheR [Methanosarcinales archaeon]|nr:protein-glutamate O-methyltransferase CheR [Methanosarcinales archaeon]
MLDEMALNNLKIFLRKRLDLDLNQYKDNYIERRLNARITMTHVDTLAGYLALLKKDPEELNTLKDHLTINVTEFFRNMETFEALNRDTIPAIIESKELGSSNTIRVWSAGCSSGQEPYTLAILFLEAFEKSRKKHRLLIIATDIDKKILEKAKSGRYERNNMEGIPKHLLTKYFDKCGEEYQIKPIVQDCINFKYLDLTSDDGSNVAGIATYDLIVCRNVIIYFKDELKKSLFMRFYTKLRKNGYLVIGKNEALSGDVKAFMEDVNLSERIYQKTK